MIKIISDSGKEYFVKWTTYGHTCVCPLIYTEVEVRSRLGTKHKLSGGNRWDGYQCEFTLFLQDAADLDDDQKKAFFKRTVEDFEKMEKLKKELDSETA